ncbi:MAG: TetR/AcrR family transcriptional regulator [Candidatus Binatia bacterium]|nr:TetR/AcrR family transcriptional regulator [Candidatus Binatia bacterium]
MAITRTASSRKRKPAAPCPRGRPAIPGLRDRILEAAISIFASQPFHEVHVEDIAMQAKVAKGTVYRHFPNKEKLYLAALFHGIDQLQAELESVARTEHDPVERLRALVKALLAFFWGRDLFFLLLHRSEERHNTPDTRSWLLRRRQFARLLMAALEEGIARGRMRNIDVRLAAEALLGMLRGVHRYRTPGDSAERSAEVITDLFLHGVLAPPAASDRERSHG